MNKLSTFSHKTKTTSGTRESLICILMASNLNCWIWMANYLGIYHLCKCKYQQMYVKQFSGIFFFHQFIMRGFKQKGHAVFVWRLRYIYFKRWGMLGQLIINVKLSSTGNNSSPTLTPQTKSITTHISSQLLCLCSFM